jgi:hypothetical protein
LDDETTTEEAAEQVADQMAKEQEQGFVGTKTDPEPNSSYAQPHVLPESDEAVAAPSEESDPSED